MDDPDFADSPSLVLSIYFPVLLLLGLWASRDIVDGRWRYTPYHVTWAGVYAILFLGGSGSVLWYTVVQGRAGDWKEVGASVLAIAFAVSQFVKTLRVFRIVHTHNSMMQGPARRIGALLRTLLPEAPPHDQLHWPAFLRLWLRGGTTAARPGVVAVARRRRRRARRRKGERRELRCFLLASSLFDDDSESNESARVTWLMPSITIREHDAEEAALRLALVLHLVLDVGRFQLLERLLRTRSYVLAFQLRPRVTTTGLLRRILAHGSAEASPPVDLVAAQTWLRDPAGELAGIGRAFFWIAVMSSREDVEDALNRFPPAWRRAPRPSAADILYEACALFVLSAAGWERVNEPEADDFGKYIWSFNAVEKGKALSEVRVGGSFVKGEEEVDEARKGKPVEPSISSYFDHVPHRVRLAHHIADSVDVCLDDRARALLLASPGLEPMIGAVYGVLGESVAPGRVFREVVRVLASDALARMHSDWHPALSRIWFTALEEDRRCTRVSAFVTSQLVHGADFGENTRSAEDLCGMWEGAEGVWGFYALASSLRKARGLHARAEVARWVVEFGLSDSWVSEAAARWSDDAGDPGDAERGWDAVHVLRCKMALDAKDVFRRATDNWGFGGAGVWMISCKEGSCESYSKSLRAYLATSAYLARAVFAVLLDLARVRTPAPSPTLAQTWQAVPAHTQAGVPPSHVQPPVRPVSVLPTPHTEIVYVPAPRPSVLLPDQSAIPVAPGAISSGDDSFAADLTDENMGEEGLRQYFPEELQPADQFLTNCVAMQLQRMDPQS